MKKAAPEEAAQLEETMRKNTYERIMLLYRA
jgi:hypothetical protein